MASAKSTLEKKSSIHNVSFQGPVANSKLLAEEASRACQEKRWEEWQVSTWLLQTTATELTSIILEAICEGNLQVKQGFLESDIIYRRYFTTEQAESLWEMGWNVRGAHSSADQVILGAFMSRLKAAYPELPGHPTWAVVSDPEEE